jgi:hypothetical protein
MHAIATVATKALKSNRINRRIRGCSLDMPIHVRRTTVGKQLPLAPTGLPTT